MRMSLRSALIVVISTIVLLTTGIARSATQYGLLFPPPDETVLDLLVHENVSNADSYFASVGFGASFYEARQGILLPRWSPDLDVGRRFGRFDVAAHFALDQSFDFTQNIERLDIYNVGVTVGFVALYGRIRSSISAGAAILGTQTDFDKKGTVGWYADGRPIAVRFGLRQPFVVEFTPLTLNVSVPVARGIPLILFSYYTAIKLEWGAGKHE